MPILHLDPLHPVQASERYSGSDHPMRAVTRSVAFGGTWDSGRPGRVREVFDGLAADWTATRDGPLRGLPLRDALDRGRVEGRQVLELGAGTGLAVDTLCDRFEVVVAVDLSLSMLSHAVTRRAPLVNADSNRLPFGDGVADVVVLMNMLLFPREVSRCLAPGGAVVWVNSRAEDTPIHLSAEEVLAAMSAAGGNRWEGVASRAGEGSWCVLRRSDSGS